VAEFAREALKPIKILSISVEEAAKQVRLTVAEEDLSKAIGRKGQNARLTSRLIGWRLDIEEFRAAGDDPRGNAIASLVKTFGLGAPIAGRLVDMGINSPAAFEGVEANDLVDAGFTPEEAADIIGRVTAAKA